MNEREEYQRLRALIAELTGEKEIEDMPVATGKSKVGVFNGKTV